MSRALTLVVGGVMVVGLAAGPVAADPAPTAPTEPAKGPSQMVEPKIMIPSPFALIPDAIRAIFSRPDDDEAAEG